MEFDKSRVYTALNADELKVGSRVIVADNLQDLKAYVTRECKAFDLKSIASEGDLYRFVVGLDTEWALAYLVAEPASLKWTDLKIGDIITNDKITALVTAIDYSEENDHHILVGDTWIANVDLKYWRKVENENND